MVSNSHILPTLPRKGAYLFAEWEDVSEGNFFTKKGKALEKKKNSTWLEKGERRITTGGDDSDVDESEYAVFSNYIPNKLKKGYYRLVAKYQNEYAVYSDQFLLRTSNYKAYSKR